MSRPAMSIRVTLAPLPTVVLLTIAPALAGAQSLAKLSVTPVTAG